MRSKPGHKVLVVDDDGRVLDGFRLTLRKHFEVLTASRALQALEMLRVHPDVAVVVSDMRMPGMDGSELLAEVQVRFPRVVRMLLTGHSDFDVALKAVNQGCVFRLALKPLDPEELLTAIGQCVHQHELLLMDDVERQIEERTRALQVLNEELSDARAEAERASRGKSYFLATVSHEIRTPMNGILGMLDVLANGELNGVQTDAVDTIRECGLTLLRLIDDTLLFSKIESGWLEFCREPVRVPDALENVCGSMSVVARENGVDIRAFADPRLATPMWFDGVRLKQLLYNLIGNAIKFSGGRPKVPGSVGVRISVEDTPHLPLVIDVSDNGIGMSAEARSRIFEPFIQAGAETARRFGGTGLGLAITRGIVQAAGGEMTLTSEPGEGACFTIRLPIEWAPDEAEVDAHSIAGTTCIVVRSDAFHPEDARQYLLSGGASVSIAEELVTDQHGSDSGRSDAVIVRSASDAFESQALPESRGRSEFESSGSVAPGARAFVDEPARTVVLSGGLPSRSVLLQAVASAASIVGGPTPNSPCRHSVASQDDRPQANLERRTRKDVILVAEDDLINQKVIRSQLEMLGYGCAVAANGLEALEMWREGSYSLLLTDVQMPEMDGNSLIRIIRSEEDEVARLPIVALTANISADERIRAQAAGVDAYLIKPIQLQSLAGVLEQWLPAEQTMDLSSAPPPDHEPSKHVFDAHAVERSIGRNPAAARSLLGEYVEVARDQSELILSAIRSGDSHEVSIVAHKLKSSSRAMGAEVLGEVCAELEAQPADASRLAERLIVELVNVEQRIDSFLRSTPDDAP